MQKVLNQLRRTQLIDFVKIYPLKQLPTTYISYPKQNLLTLTSKFNMSTHAIHHKNAVRSNYSGQGFQL
jgi:hypothetical protein